MDTVTVLRNKSRNNTARKETHHAGSTNFTIILPALYHWPPSTQHMDDSRNHGPFRHSAQKSNLPGACYSLPHQSLAQVVWLAKLRSHSGALTAKESAKPNGYPCHCGCFGWQDFLLLTVKDLQNMLRILNRPGQSRMNDERYLHTHLQVYLSIWASDQLDYVPRLQNSGCSVSIVVHSIA